MARVKTKSWKDVERKLFKPSEIAEATRYAQSEVLEMNLRELRQVTGKTQTEVAAAADMQQGELSRAERRDDHLLSTLRRYVEGLGGELEILAHVNGKTVKLRGV
jgi:hypothetical protein